MANKDPQEFSLDDILNEFLVDAAPEKSPVKEPASQGSSAKFDTLTRLDALLFDAPKDTSESGLDTLLFETPTEASERGMDALVLTEKEEKPESKPEDTLKSPEDASAPADDDLLSELDSLLGEFPQPETSAPQAASVADETIRFTPEILEDVPDSEEAPDPILSEDTTIRMDDVVSQFMEEESQKAAAAPKAEPAIIYNPRTRLRELKKKLVAGPEKRYYELSEQGIGKVQVAILVSIIIVILCALTTTMFTMGLVPENRLRFLIFSQVLAMLVSALLGADQMIDGLADLFRGRFGVNTMLSITFAACCVDSVLCLMELRVPCCAAFSLEMAMALWARYERHSTEMAQMDTMRKAVRLNSVVKVDNYYNGQAGILRGLGEVEDFMDTYNKPSTPERVQGFFAFISMLVCFGIAAFAGMNHGMSLAVQVLSTSLLVAVPASAFVAVTRPMAILERRLHMVGTVLCGWKGIRSLSGKAAFPIDDSDLFPVGSSKLNGVKFYGDRNPDEVVSYAASLIGVAGGGLVPLFENLRKNRSCPEYPVTNFRNYGDGGVGGEVQNQPVLLGNLDFLQDMGVEIPAGTMVNQAVYAAVDGELCAVFAISYAKMRSSSAGLISLCSSRKLTPVIISQDFMLTESLIQDKFGVNTRRVAFPAPEVRAELAQRQATPEDTALALATREDLVSITYAVSGARALRTSTNLGVGLNIFGGILGMVIMLVLAYLGSVELLTPTNVLLYQLVWMLPSLLICEWTRTV